MTERICEECHEDPVEYVKADGVGLCFGCSCRRKHVRDVMDRTGREPCEACGAPSSAWRRGCGFLCAGCDPAKADPSEIARRLALWPILAARRAQAALQ